eukprot:CAMPEP_0202861610 /NCGR_PEP_ID=MMETSP1391-20130828/2941_1 /ASSEMBLY_ACC=CAM_ASM_000867 /TAXON_ID=1034604 /ORGANISM="Chlamydomonas leiostraca, Strain SAG 11-49" /LENGTH=53 /DNA_ID=CAMNT_0049541027 /DNA_START=1007 /DNA_END=1168 /DNA_ORIENTATION=+
MTARQAQRGPRSPSARPCVPALPCAGALVRAGPTSQPPAAPSEMWDVQGTQAV